MPDTGFLTIFGLNSMNRLRFFSEQKTDYIRIDKETLGMPPVNNDDFLRIQTASKPSDQ
ncbi:MAG: hypothetical protein J6Y79_02940 [Paludibacteraceae bacterium]|nr:hypothetical protein [Paludibacteraceae bacterium]